MGHFADRLGGQYSVIAACLSAGLCHLAFGLLDHAQCLSKATVLFGYGVIQVSRALSIVAVTKSCAAWYERDEHGTFAGVFTAIVFGGEWVLETPMQAAFECVGQRWFFYAASAVFMALAGATGLGLLSEPRQGVHAPLWGATTASIGVNGLGEVVRLRMIWGFTTAMVCLSMVQHGFFAHIAAYLAESKVIPIDPDKLCGAWRMGSCIGGVVCGVASDTFFRAHRGPTLVVLSFVQATLLYLVYVVGPSHDVQGLVVAVAAVLQGNISVAGLAVPLDLPVEIAASATGVLVAARYLGEGAAVAIVDTVVHHWGYQVWMATLLFVSIATGFCVLCTYLAVLRPRSRPIPELIPLYRIKREHPDVAMVYVARRVSL
ncbi:Major Facilitator Superfamily (MFS) [Achlya hypogyna]|uniref:Major Facilitator Superfamily (MFS) n=1 Tax=Achlya hypogyna TaxID=1202772 RepID=A0A1V9Y567_ACHHY|nr:Major Facilitator Superfamily (MFS) [Achlya hypogyna]